MGVQPSTVFRPESFFSGALSFHRKWINCQPGLEKKNGGYDMYFSAFRMTYGCFQKYGETPKSSNLIGFSIINHPFWGAIIFGNTHIFACSLFVDKLCHQFVTSDLELTEYALGDWPKKLIDNRL